MALSMRVVLQQLLSFLVKQRSYLTRRDGALDIAVLLTGATALSMGVVMC